MAITPPLAKRTRYLGRQAANPTPTEEACWYYNTVVKRFRYWNGTEWIPFPVGEWDDTGETTLVVAASGNYPMNITAPQLAAIQYIVEINIDTNPVCDPGSITNKVITGNVVGFTLVGVGQGTTLTAKLTAVNSA